MNITIYNYKNEKVTPWEWKPDKATNYRYVQDPGEHNSLGNMKILFNNKYAVYLHDTNHKDGFSRNFRSLSSGCIRVENPLKLAQYVLNDTTNFNDEKVLKIIEARKTVTHNIKQEIQHFQLYYTAWLQNNKLIFRDDIYKLDFDLYCRLRNRF
jgi:murein L,D-transpeptidase YcbB/YkuD